ncbi:MAG: hypothetical protein EA380_03880 [Phycisphaeraceae bacterium]|nr:MAG: hypothetical protein EA380_03880 [Phycisphaeraceae bacterium]
MLPVGGVADRAWHGVRLSRGVKIGPATIRELPLVTETGHRVRPIEEREERGSSGCRACRDSYERADVCRELRLPYDEYLARQNRRLRLVDIPLDSGEREPMREAPPEGGRAAASRGLNPWPRLGDVSEGGGETRRAEIVDRYQRTVMAPSTHRMDVFG